MTGERRLAFGGVAELYDLARPSYPDALIDDLLELAPAAGLRRALEVGSGTGKATMQLALRGVAVLGLEPSAGMAAIARRNCAAFETVRIEQAEFEAWEPRGERFPLLFSAQAWHWIAPEVRYVKAHEVLEPDGLLAVFWNRPVWGELAVHAALEDAYERASPELLPGETRPMHPGSRSSNDARRYRLDELASAEGFAQAQERRYEWRARYTTEEYLRLLQTHSDHAVLEPGKRAVLLEAVAEVLDGNGGGLELDYVTQLFAARRSG